MSKNKQLSVLILSVLLLATFTFVRAVFSATTSTPGVTNINATYTNPGGGGGGGGGDTTAPSNINNLTVIGVTPITATLQWTAPGDDGPDGIARQYTVRYTTSGYITDETIWAGATNASNPPAPQIGGTAQTMVVSGLNPDTTYYFAVKTVDDASNWSGLSNSASGKTLVAVDTTPPVISDIHSLVGTPDVYPYVGFAEIVWHTDELTTYTVYYGKTIDYELGSQSGGAAGNSFSVILGSAGQPLESNTLYHFKIRATDLNGNWTDSTDQTFQTLDTIPPVISQITVQPRINDATIAWLTDEPADSQVAYGTNHDLLNTLKTDATLTAEHSLNLPGLITNTRYYYVVRSTDANGNQGTTAVLFFNTLPDVNPPANVANFRAQPGNKQIVLAWDNPSDPDYAGVVIRRSTTDYPRDERDGVQVYRGPDSGLIDTGLENGVLYYYSAFAYDTSGNYASGALVSAVPQGEGMPEVPPSVPPTGCVGPACEIATSTPPVAPAGQLTFVDWDFFTARRSIKVEPTSSGVLPVLTGQDLIASLDAQKLKQPAKNITLQLADSIYRLDLDRFGNYSTDVMVPVLPYKYNAVLRVEYQDSGITPGVIPFNVEVAPGGLVYTDTSRGRQPLQGATVELYFLNAANVWEKWHADAYKQNNPQIAAELGSYGFVVPGGTYYLRASHDGFRAYESNRFTISAYAIINQSIGLTAAPPSLAEVIEPNAPIAKNVVNVAKNLGQKTAYISKIATTEAVKVLTNPEVKKATEQVAAPIVAGAVVVTTAAAEASQLLLYLRFLFTQPILVFFRRKRKGWGVIYNSLTKMPVDLVIVRLVEAETRRIRQSRVTDKNGRYAFIAAPGRYKIEINQEQFVFPTHFLAELKDDGAYLDVYHGEVIEVREKGALIAANIPLDPVGAERPVGKIVRQLLARKLQNVLSIVSLVLAVIFVIITPGVLTIGLLAVQVVFYFLFRRVAMPPKPKSWGIVYDESTRHPLQTVAARIFDKQYNKLLESQITDARGRYSFLVGRNEYYITYEKNGYHKRQTDTIDLRNQPEAATSVGVDVDLKPEDKNLENLTQIK